MSLESALADLASKIGTELHVSPWVTVTQERIDRFADATGIVFRGDYRTRISCALALSEHAWSRRQEHAAASRRDPHDQHSNGAFAGRPAFSSFRFEGSRFPPNALIRKVSYSSWNV